MSLTDEQREVLGETATQLSRAATGNCYPEDARNALDCLRSAFPEAFAPELLPCPFCGAAAMVSTDGVYCDGDGCTAAVLATDIERARRLWNRRAGKVER